MLCFQFRSRFHFSFVLYLHCSPLLAQHHWLSLLFRGLALAFSFFPVLQPAPVLKVTEVTLLYLVLRHKLWGRLFFLRREGEGGVGGRGKEREGGRKRGREGEREGGREKEKGREWEREGGRGGRGKFCCMVCSITLSGSGNLCFVYRSLEHSSLCGIQTINFHTCIRFCTSSSSSADNSSSSRAFSNASEGKL